MYIAITDALSARKSWFVLRAFVWHKIKMMLGKKPRYSMTLTLNHDMRLGCIIAGFSNQSEARQYALLWYKTLGMLMVLKTESDSYAE